MRARSLVLPLLLVLPSLLAACSATPARPMDASVPDLTPAVTFDFGQPVTSGDDSAAPADLDVDLRSSTVPDLAMPAPADLTAALLDAARAQDAASARDAATAIDLSATVADLSATPADARVSSQDAAADAALDASVRRDASAGPVDATGLPANTFIGNTKAFVTGGRQLNLFNDTIAAGSTVSATTQTYPMGSVKGVHAVYADNGSFTNASDVLLSYDTASGNNDQWYVVLPAEPAGTTIVWYLYAEGWDGTRRYDSGNNQNFRYTSQ